MRARALQLPVASPKRAGDREECTARSMLLGKNSRGQSELGVPTSAHQPVSDTFTFCAEAGRERYSDEKKTKPNAIGTGFWPAGSWLFGDT